MLASTTRSFACSNYYYSETTNFSIGLQDHVEGYLELSAKTKIYFATAVSMWDAEFYIKVDDDVHVNIGDGLIKIPILAFVYWFSSNVCCFFSHFVLVQHL